MRQFQIGTSVRAILFEIAPPIIDVQAVHDEVHLWPQFRELPQREIDEVSITTTHIKNCYRAVEEASLGNESVDYGDKMLMSQRFRSSQRYFRDVLRAMNLATSKVWIFREISHIASGGLSRVLTMSDGASFGALNDTAGTTGGGLPFG